MNLFVKGSLILVVTFYSTAIMLVSSQLNSIQDILYSTSKNNRNKCVDGYE